MPGLLQRGALPWALLLLPLHFQLLLTHAWHFHEQRDCDEYNVMARYLPATVEFAIHTFNQRSKDHYAYRLVHILNSWKEQVESKTVFSMELLLGRTRCGKFEEDIDNCPFQESPELNSVFEISDQRFRKSTHLEPNHVVQIIKHQHVQKLCVL
ncbi:Cystatin-9-like [Saguinus oedipus]|uniref:Cystatin-9-like n=1 Tax=Saguinus oedipus TaxID=9490 RepID=A0ABQ9VLL5_SAGOE|nr:Cystatin-9-like [Saguinus oedipus]